MAPRAGSHRDRLLEVYAEHPQGLTDEQAATYAGLTANPRSCWWKRCSELRQEGLIEILLDGAGNPVQRVGSAGSLRVVCRLTT